MRITINIDDDILAAAQELARRDQKSVGEVISGLARQGLPRGGQCRESTTRNGVTLLPTRPGALVTPELIDQLHSELP